MLFFDADRLDWLLNAVQDELFWTDWHKQSILKVNRRRSAVLNDSSVELVADGLTTPMDVRIHHSLRQPPSKSWSNIDDFM